MKLDKRIMIGRKFLDCFDTDTAMQFINEKCYFGEDITDFEDISKLPCSMLYSVDNSSAPYDYYKEGILHSTGFILPCAWVKEPEKTYRPYTVMEFIKEYPLGSYLHFRPKSNTMEMYRLIDGYNDYKDGRGTLFMCGAGFSMSELYDNYEIFKDGEWVPFGIEVEE